MSVTDLKAGNGASYAPVATSDEKPKLQQMELDESKTKVTNIFFVIFASSSYFHLRSGQNLKRILMT